MPNPKDPVKNVMKGLGFPDLVQDALPSSIAQKMSNLIRNIVCLPKWALECSYYSPALSYLILRMCLEKRVSKMSDFHKKYNESGVEMTEIQSRFPVFNSQTSHKQTNIIGPAWGVKSKPRLHLSHQNKTALVG